MVLTNEWRKNRLKLLIILILNFVGGIVFADDTYDSLTISSLQQIGEKNENLRLVNEQIELTLLDYGRYQFDGTYVIKNNGSDCIQMVQMTSRLDDALLPSDVGIPGELDFFVNGKKMAYNTVLELDDKDIRIPGYRDDRYIISIDADFKGGESTSIYVTYKNGIHYSGGLGQFHKIICNTSDFSGASKNHPFTLTIKNRCEDIRWISDIQFNRDETFSSLMREHNALQTNFFTFTILNEHDIMFTFSNNWRDRLADRSLDDAGEIFISIAHFSAELGGYFSFGKFGDVSNPIYWGNPKLGNISLDNITPFELALLTAKQLRVFRNVYYALYGYSFKDEYLKIIFTQEYKYLNQMFGRRSKIFNEHLLTDIERENIQTIQKLESAKNGNGP
jgi:hypothetical protein